ncbi:MAG: hydantoinase/oxoprolinase family protein [Deltaproteobacteria bacterium]|nr:hydantoinase/oxoprolinase family protein [Deltaproteobacteria bacterium]MCZ6620555.1 hydantoinase/oxoprolinase family protein [Deltaproteobacteria bacterium]
MEYIVGVDIGGTFTDCVAMNEEGRVTLGKALSTPENLALGAVDAVRDAALNLNLQSEDRLLRSTRLFFHACTIGENTLITRSGAKTGLITTKGFADTLLMMRGRTTEGLTEAEAFRASAQNKPLPIVPRELIEEVSERIDYKGSVLIELDTAEAEEVIERLVARGVESIAVCLLWSLSNDTHEKALEEILSKKFPAIFISLSSRVAPFVGEYERTATTAFNAYIGPRISGYLEQLRRVLQEKGLGKGPLVMQAYGGVLGIEATCKNAVGTIESGPASGVVGSQFLGKLIGMPNILATDMGGTTFKVSVIRNGNIEKHYNPVIFQYQMFSTKIWVESIGAGGGSLTWIDPETGLLKVGPDGAGARPGPVCYGLGGTHPTVSDADLILGYLNADYFLGGRMKLHKDRAIRALEEKIARPLGLSIVETASGIYRIANSHMSDLIRKATVERGYDPREFTLLAYGGAGAVHAGRYAAELGVKQVVIPLTASVHGATGLVCSDVVYEYGKSERLVVPADAKRINVNFSMLANMAFEDLRSAGFRNEDIRIVRSVDMRYRYQVHELNVSLPDGVSEITENGMEEIYYRFDDLYEQTYGKGSGYREAGKEIVNFRVTAIGEIDKPNIKKYPLEKKDPDHALKGGRDVYFEESGDFVATRIYDFERMTPGTELLGPAIVETPVTTIVVNPMDRLVMDEFRNVRISIGR